MFRNDFLRTVDLTVWLQLGCFTYYNWPPKSVRNRIVIEFFRHVFVLSLCLFDITVGIGGFDIGLSQISSFSSSWTGVAWKQETLMIAGCMVSLRNIHVFLCSALCIQEMEIDMVKTVNSIRFQNGVSIVESASILYLQQFLVPLDLDTKWRVIFYFMVIPPLKSLSSLPTKPLTCIKQGVQIRYTAHQPTHGEVYKFRDWILLVCFSWRYEATEGPRVNFVMREALFEIYTWILCRFIPPWEQTSRIYTLTTLSKLYRFGYEISVF